MNINFVLCVCWVRNETGLHTLVIKFSNNSRSGKKTRGISPTMLFRFPSIGNQLCAVLVSFRWLFDWRKKWHSSKRSETLWNMHDDLIKRIDFLWLCRWPHLHIMNTTSCRSAIHYPNLHSLWRLEGLRRNQSIYSGIDKNLFLISSNRHVSCLTFRRPRRWLKLRTLDGVACSSVVNNDWVKT